MIPVNFPEWDELPLRVQIGRNLARLLPGHRMHISADWQNARVEATVHNRMRINLHKLARQKRLQVYLNKQAKRAARAGNNVAMRYSFYSSRTGRETAPDGTVIRPGLTAVK